MKDRIAKSVLWIFWSRGGLQALSFASTLLVARLLSPGDYGLMALAGIFVFVLGLIVEALPGGSAPRPLKACSRCWG